MKTSLLFLSLFLFTFSYAQININESFETSFPMGWTTTGQSAGFSRVQTTSACSGNYAMRAILHPSNNNAMMITSNYVIDGQAIVASFLYNRGIGAITGNVYLYYDVNNANSWQQIATSSNFNPGCQRLTGTIAANLVPVGVNIRFRMQITSSSNITVFIDDLKVNQKPVASEYTFDTIATDTDGHFPFTLANTSFVNDRFGNPNAAMQIGANVSGSQAVISLLPKGNNPRSFSLWYKTNINNNANVFTYGTACQDCNFGTYLGASGNPFFQSFITDTNFEGNYAANSWHHIVVTYDGTNVKMYMKGVLIGTQAYALVTGNNSSFRLGGNASSLTVDDLKIYDRAITDAEVLNLYTNNSLSSSAFVKNNLKVALYPNPVNDVINIETETEIKSVDVYNLLGTKIKTATSKQVNVFDLAAGTYLVKIQDKNNAVQTMKFVKQ